MNYFYLTKVFHFNAAHQYGHKNWSHKKNEEIFGVDARLHGHNYVLEVMVKGSIDPATGYVVDLGQLKKIVNDFVINVLDHTRLEKDISWFKDKQPSSENLVMFIWGEISARLDKGLYRIRLRETPSIFTDYYGPEI